MGNKAFLRCAECVLTKTIRTSFAAVWTNHTAMKYCYQQQDKSDYVAKSLIASRKNRIVMNKDVPVASFADVPKFAVWTYQFVLQKPDCQKDKSYRDATAPLCHTSPSGQIRLYWHRDVLCVSLRRCVINGYFQNSCFNFMHEKRLAEKFRCNTPVKRNRNSCSENIQ